eukprot:GEMP01128661.1.p1 GENE.GEMP01128661.1~~GEMP01128661.1.p1  ORF type:complete len:114 (+),score=16.95 GEMP01128661.1:116-457(+)
MGKKFFDKPISKTKLLGEQVQKPTTKKDGLTREERRQRNLRISNEILEERHITKFASRRTTPSRIMITKDDEAPILTVASSAKIDRTAENTQRLRKRTKVSPALQKLVASLYK